MLRSFTRIVFVIYLTFISSCATQKVTGYNSVNNTQRWNDSFISAIGKTAIDDLSSLCTNKGVNLVKTQLNFVHNLVMALAYKNYTPTKSNIYCN